LERKKLAMSKAIVTCFILPFLLLFARSETDGTVAGVQQQSSPSNENANGTLQKMIVENGSVTLNLDLNGLNGSNDLTSRPATLQFGAATNSFLPILVFNNQLRGLEPGSIALVPQGRANPLLPSVLAASLKRLVVQKLSPEAAFDLALRDARSGLTFFNVQGHEYQYDSKTQSLNIQGGRLLISDEFARALGRPSDAGTYVGSLSIGATMEPIEITQIVSGEPKSVVMPPLVGTTQGDVPTRTSGPDVIVGDLPDVEQLGSFGTQVGVAVATTSCNAGDQPVDWFALPQTDHPVVPQNLYRMSGGTDNTERFEQIGQSWLKHTFFALEDDACSFGCNTSGCATGSHLCPGCSDPYDASLNGGQDGIGSRAWVNPFTGDFPSNANDHSGHHHDGVSHRVRVEVDDLNQSLNQGAIYFAEAQYVAPSEYTWCQAHPTECNMSNNASYREYSVSGTSNFSFSPVGNTVRMLAAIWAWTGATVNRQEPDPGNDGFWFMGYKVTNPSAGVWHYEYALYNMNLDRAIQSFSVPLASGVNISNIGFHAPPQEPGWSNDGTLNNQGYSSTPWTVTQTTDSITWNTETFAQNQNANAIRWGTLYNFRFDADQPPEGVNATVGYFKTGSPITVAIQAPAGVGTPSPTPTATATATATTTPSATPTATTTVTPSTTPSATPRFTPTPRFEPTARPRPTPPPRP
jgi:hypothetical protein